MATKEDAQKAVSTLLNWIGEDPSREGLQDTPQRVVEAYSEFFSGYSECPHEVLKQSFSEVNGFHDIIVLEKIPFSSHCEHHMIPFFGHATIAYIPHTRVVGFSRLIRVLEIFSRRLQIQERLTEQVAKTIFESLQPQGVAVILNAQHMCMSMRGIRQPGVSVKTNSFWGAFQKTEIQNKLFQMCTHN